MNKNRIKQYKKEFVQLFTASLPKITLEESQVKSHLEKKQVVNKMIRNKLKFRLKAFFDFGIINGREHYILSNRFYNGATLEELAKNFNITRERVRQLEEIAIKKIKEFK
jgi:DNA-directed RNA polymerase sigma subunit (sigma70/sigma32)|tara:strand:- start:1792 stop:2121 length:330 start_codon:yes stop_codon:yes gene_type:complete